MLAAAGAGPLSSPGTPAAHPGVVQDSLVVTGEHSGDLRVRLTVRRIGGGCAQLRDLTVAVRDEGGTNLDFQGVPDVSVCDLSADSGLVYTAAQHLEPGQYTFYGAFRYQGRWVDLPTGDVTVGEPRLPVASPLPSPTPG